MNYQVFINQKEILTGDIFIVGAVLLFLTIIVIYSIRVIWKKLMAYETLKYEFVTIIAHKFRTPLTQIKWILETMVETETDSFKKENLNNIGKSASTLISLTNTLVDITDSANSVRASYNFERTNVCDTVRKIANSLKERFHEKNIFFGITCSVPELFVKMDISRMDFVFQTLIENSINYSPAGRSVEITLAKSKGKIIISIIDQGIGIDPSDMPRIFTKFFRASNAQLMDTEGFGVGLYLAHSVVRRHHGKLEAFSQGINRGSTFMITLPAVK